MTCMFSKELSLALVFCTAGNLVVGQEFSGKVTDTNGFPVGGYPVIIEEISENGGDELMVTFTDGTGKFSVDALPEGVYAVVPANEPQAHALITVRRKISSEIKDDMLIGSDVQRLTDGYYQLEEPNVKSIENAMEAATRIGDEYDAGIDLKEYALDPSIAAAGVVHDLGVMPLTWATQ